MITHNLGYPRIGDDRPLKKLVKSYWKAEIDKSTLVDEGIAMGKTDTDVAIETADITLMRDDWNLVPVLFTSANKTMNIIKWNFEFTTAYNLVGLSLAAFGILPPVLAAAAQSLPDVGIMLNSSRLLTK